MAEYRNRTDSELWVPLVDKAVGPGESFEVDDEVAREHAFSPEIFETVVEPAPLPEPKRPAKNAKVEAWQEYARALGADTDRVAAMGRDELIAEFGEKED